MSTSAASTVLQKHIKNKDLLRFTSLIGGEWCQAASSKEYEVINPATEEAIASVSSAGAAETSRAISCAEAAWPSWRSTTAKHRSQLLKAWHAAILENQDDIVNIMVLECGKPVKEAQNEFAAGVASVEWFAEEAKRLTGAVLQPTAASRRHLTMLQPVGVVAAITPWNFPFSMITRKVAPALAAGCPVVLKPSEETPLTALALARLAQSAGLPDGVLNVVSGDAVDIGETLTASPVVRKIGFTGSTQVGKLLLRQSADTVKRASMELGGNAPFIVFADADVAAAAAAIAASGLRNAGQTCVCANRVLVAAELHDALRDTLVEHMASLSVGDGLDPGTDIGPCINRARVEHAAAHVADAVDGGARVACGGGPPDGATKGFFFAPTVLQGVTTEMRVFREETFAPVIPMLTFETEEEAIALANDTEYGLAAYFFTRDVGRTFRVAEALEYGMVGVNETAIVSETAPFGGVKQSGLGRENGAAGILEFVEEKHVCIGGV
eukprot:jgi/Ulvmu1/11291/UM074_0006.1